MTALFDRVSLRRRQIERAAHARRLGRGLEGGRQLLLGRAGHRPQALDEYLAHAFLEARGGEVVSVLRAMAKTSFWVQRTISSVQVLLFVSQRFLAFGAQRVGILSRFVEQPLTFGFRLVRRLAQEAGTLLVELLVLVLELVALLLGFGFFRVGVREFRGDPLSPAHQWRAGWACKESASATTPG